MPVGVVQKEALFLNRFQKCVKLVGQFPVEEQSLPKLCFCDIVVDAPAGANQATVSFFDMGQLLGERDMRVTRLEKVGDLKSRRKVSEAVMTLRLELEVEQVFHRPPHDVRYLFRIVILSRSAGSSLTRASPTDRT